MTDANEKILTEMKNYFKNKNLIIPEGICFFD